MKLSELKNYNLKQLPFFIKLKKYDCYLKNNTLKVILFV